MDDADYFYSFVCENEEPKSQLQLILQNCEEKRGKIYLKLPVINLQQASKDNDQSPMIDRLTEHWKR